MAGTKVYRKDHCSKWDLCNPHHPDKQGQGRGFVPKPDPFRI
jgi:hypothetical protein